MARALIECVPNFSEGRDVRIVEAIVDVIAGTPGVLVLGYESDADHNRSVVTFAGRPQAVVNGAMRGVAKAVERIDLSAHTGVHPRIGAADVVPLIPIEGVTLAECVSLAHELGREVWRILRVPVYFYEAAARTADRRRLENVRRGGLAWLREHVVERPPDEGVAALHPTAGAVVIGARKFLVAFNVNLATADVEIAKSIARAVRESSGGLPSLKAIGVPLESRGLAQVAMNITDFDVTGIGPAFAAVESEAARHNTSIASSQIIGLVPRKAFEQAAAHFVKCENFTRDRVLENRLETLSLTRGFDEALDDIANPASPMGGGSASAMGAAIASSLGQMVARLSGVGAERFADHREFFSSVVERDAEAFNGVLMARKGEGPDRERALQQAWRAAAIVPAELTERAKELDRDLLALKEQAPSKFHSDVMTALGLSRAARAGGIAAARANLVFIDDEEFRKSIEARLDRRPTSA